MIFFFKRVSGFFTFSLIFFFFNIKFQHLPQDTWRDFSQHYRQYIEINDNRLNSNAIIIGTSIGAHSIRPSSLNCDKLSFFNFAFNGANPRFYLDWYNSIFSKYYAKPKYCIYEVDEGFTLNSNIRDLKDHYKFMPIGLMIKSGHIWNMQYAEQKDYLTSTVKEILRLNLLSIVEKLKWNDTVEDFNKETYKFRINRRYEFFENDYDDGFIPFITRNKDPLDNSPEDFEDVLRGNGKNKALKNNREDFEQLITLLKRDDIELILLMCPEYDSPKSKFETSSGVKYFQEIAKKHDIPFINYNVEYRNDEFNQNPEFFSDKIHMSPIGSEHFSKRLSKDLSQYLNSCTN